MHTLERGRAGARSRAEHRKRAVAIVVERNRKYGQAAGQAQSAGYTVKTYEDENTAIAPILHSDPQVGLWLVVGEAVAAAAIAEGLKTPPAGKRCVGVVYGAGDEVDLALMFEQPAIAAVLGSSLRQDARTSKRSCSTSRHFCAASRFCRSRVFCSGARRRFRPASPTSVVAMPPNLGW